VEEEISRHGNFPMVAPVKPYTLQHPMSSQCYYNKLEADWSTWWRTTFDTLCTQGGIPKWPQLV
jgi:hypothetical protein